MRGGRGAPGEVLLGRGEGERRRASKEGGFAGLGEGVCGAEGRKREEEKCERALPSRAKGEGRELKKTPYQLFWGGQWGTAGCGRP